MESEELISIFKQILLTPPEYLPQDSQNSFQRSLRKAPSPALFKMRNFLEIMKSQISSKNYSTYSSLLTSLLDNQDFLPGRISPDILEPIMETSVLHPSRLTGSNEIAEISTGTSIWALYLKRQLLEKNRIDQRQMLSAVSIKFLIHNLVKKSLSVGFQVIFRVGNKKENNFSMSFDHSFSLENPYNLIISPSNEKSQSKLSEKSLRLQGIDLYKFNLICFKFSLRTLKLYFSMTVSLTNKVLSEIQVNTRFFDLGKIEGLLRIAGIRLIREYFQNIFADNIEIIQGKNRLSWEFMTNVNRFTNLIVKVFVRNLKTTFDLLMEEEEIIIEYDHKECSTKLTDFIKLEMIFFKIAIRTMRVYFLETTRIEKVLTTCKEVGHSAKIIDLYKLDLIFLKFSCRILKIYFADIIYEENLIKTFEENGQTVKVANMTYFELHIFKATLRIIKKYFLKIIKTIEYQNKESMIIFPDSQKLKNILFSILLKNMKKYFENIIYEEIVTEYEEKSSQAKFVDFYRLKVILTQNLLLSIKIYFFDIITEVKPVLIQSDKGSFVKLIDYPKLALLLYKISLRNRKKYFFEIIEEEKIVLEYSEKSSLANFANLYRLELLLFKLSQRNLKKYFIEIVVEEKIPTSYTEHGETIKIIDFYKFELLVFKMSLRAIKTYFSVLIVKEIKDQITETKFVDILKIKLSIIKLSIRHIRSYFSLIMEEEKIEIELKDQISTAKIVDLIKFKMLLLKLLSRTEKIYFLSLSTEEKKIIALKDQKISAKIVDLNYFSLILFRLSSQKLRLLFSLIISNSLTHDKKQKSLKFLAKISKSFLSKSFSSFKHSLQKKALTGSKCSSSLLKLIRSHLHKNFKTLITYPNKLLKSGFSAFTRNLYFEMIESNNADWKWKVANSESKWYMKSLKSSKMNKHTVSLFSSLDNYILDLTTFAMNRLKRILNYSKAIKKIKKYHNQKLKQALLKLNYMTKSSKSEAIEHYKSTLKSLVQSIQLNLSKVKAKVFYRFRKNLKLT